MPQIALVAGSYQPERCGVAHYTAHLRQALQHQGLSSQVLTTVAAATGTDPAIRGVVDRWHMTQLPRLVQAIGRSGADLLHIQHAAGTYQFDRAIFLLPPLLRLAGWRRPIVTTVHEYGWWEWQPPLLPAKLLEWLKVSGQRRGWWDREDGFLLTGSDALITTNQAATAVIQERLPQVCDRLWEIPIGVNVTVHPIDRRLAREQLRQQCGWAADTKVLTFFGFLHPVKGLETLLVAFQQLLTAHPNTRLLLLGGVESLALQGEDAHRYWVKLESRIGALGLQETVHMTGYMAAEQASHLLQGADIGVLPFYPGVTLKSGSLLALLAHGLPVVATQSQPVDPDLVQDSRITLVPPRDAVALTVALTALLEGNFQRQSQGCQVSQRFDWATIAAQHQEIYQTVLTQRGVNPERKLHDSHTATVH